MDRQPEVVLLFTPAAPVAGRPNPSELWRSMIAEPGLTKPDGSSCAAALAGAY